MSKVNVLIFSAIVGFGFTAGVQIYITWGKNHQLRMELFY